ncbi:ABC-type amino acid transport system, permease and periplasmic component [Pediococcus damnosus]|uniref:ABC transporter substrate-binding protein/permease n=1 Tax=Pediococcus damnosus TaxID=51663 RepID=UPI00078DAEE8|nr:ABC transporter substrate-binding protein/permease [Pediococcus damnosus]AMV59792.1 ABC-type amino acid transport system, permease and periplasmic component [Pediococcus damnosus]
MKKKFIEIIAIIGLLVTMIPFGNVHAAGTNTSSNDQSLAKIQKKGVLVMGTSPDYAPYEFQTTKNGKSVDVGMDISIAKQIAKDLGVKLEIKNMDFDSLLVALQTGKVDMVMAGMNPTPARRKSVTFSNIYYQGGQDIVINKKDNKIYKNKDSFVNKTVGAQTGTMQYNMAKKQIPNVKVKGFDKGADLILALQTNKIDGIVMEKPSAEAYVKNNSQLSLINGNFNLSKDESSSAIAFQKGSNTLAAAVNKSLAKIKKKDLINKEYLKDAGSHMKTNTVDTSMWHYWKYFAKGIGYTLLISAFSVFFGFILGTILAFMRLSRNKLFKAVSTAYIEFIRGTPLMVQIMFVYFGIGLVVNIPALTSGIIAVSLNSGAYVAEVIRGGINSIDKGQTEAARSLGLSKNYTMRYVVLPQAIKNIWPALGNEFISLIKESSIVSIIGVTDLIYQLKIVQSDTYRGVAPIVVAMLLYFVVTFSLSKVLSYFEGRMKHAN